MLDVQYGNVTQADATRMAVAAWEAPDEEHAPNHEPGETEPWISRLVAGLVIATNPQSVLETGGFTGATSHWIVNALDLLHTTNRVFTICEIEADRAEGLRNRFNWIGAPKIVHDDILHFLRTTDQTFDLAWVDDSHLEGHVRAELALLMPRMRPGGLVLMHDVVGLCPGNREPLGRVCEAFGGYVLDLPRMGMAGGLGVIQIPFK